MNGSWSYDDRSVSNIELIVLIRTVPFSTRHNLSPPHESERQNTYRITLFVSWTYSVLLTWCINYLFNLWFINLEWFRRKIGVWISNFRIWNLELILPVLQSGTFCACIMFNADLDCIRSFIFSLILWFRFSRFDNSRVNRSFSSFFELKLYFTIFFCLSLSFGARSLDLDELYDSLPHYWKCHIHY